MTYRELLNKLQNLDSEQLDFDIAVYIPWTDEYHGARNLFFADEENDVFDEEQPIILLTE